MSENGSSPPSAPQEMDPTHQPTPQDPTENTAAPVAQDDGREQARGLVSDDNDDSEAPSPAKRNAPSLLGTPGSIKAKKGRPQTLLQSRVTTSVSLTDIEMTGEMDKSPAPSRSASRRPSMAANARHVSKGYGDADDSASIRSFASRAPTLPPGEAESLVDAVFKRDIGEVEEFDEVEEDAIGRIQDDEQNFASQFESEFVELETLREEGSSEESLQIAWSLKLKHFMILSSAGKPIWTRHGDDQLITSTIGVIQTIISFYQEEDDSLKSFTAGDARFAILSKGHLHLVAVSRMGENDAQLRTQLEALYMQILSTLTLPNLEKMFTNRPSTDLRRPLQGTETLLSALADGFSRGSPSTLLSSLESLRLRKAQRVAINNVLIKARDPALLYGLLVTGSGQLISVLRPKKHSLHPGDLHLIFNMLFEAKGVRAGGGENWVPLCLPGFNNAGFVYMYVSFMDIHAHLSENITSKDKDTNAAPPPQSPAQTTNKAASITSDGSGRGTPTPKSQSARTATPTTELAVILISTSRDAFFAMQQMRDNIVTSLTTTASLGTISAALLSSHSSLQTLMPGTPLLHFLYKSRQHVQFVHPSPHPRFASPLAWRRLMTRYAALHASIHGRAGRSKAVWIVERDAAGGGTLGVAWTTPTFELYGVAELRAGRGAVARALAEVVAWVRREEERVFVVGGAVF